MKKTVRMLLVVLLVFGTLPCLGCAGPQETQIWAGQKIPGTKETVLFVNPLIMLTHDGRWAIRKYYRGNEIGNCKITFLGLAWVRLRCDKD